ncbi:MAG: hypothetical protein COB71_04745 [Thiotrichales bacterium]|nr:MAG: hypothetical protein COB71_04745 [Thiotrichales bacterium]
MKRLKFLYALSFLLIFSLFANANENIDNSHSPLAFKITINSVNLKAQDFFESYMSSDPKEREKAELYLLGVMDATEGQSWCDYKTFKTITLRESVFEGFKKVTKNKLDYRASIIIKEILNQDYPYCGK